MKTAAIVGWSGYGTLGDLKRSAASKLAMAEDAIEVGPKSLTMRRADPIAVARRLAYLPGVEWIAVGYEFAGEAGCTLALQELAKRYLRPGSGFKLTAQVERSDEEEGDLLLDGNGTLLKSVKGTRVDEKDPNVTFRIIMVRNKGAAGVELKRGPGGVPTSRSTNVTCLVSGGYHSAVAAWMAALSGYSVTLVHARADDESLRQVARLYAELSRRVDPTALKLQVLDGAGSPGDRLATWLDGARGEIIAGVHPECRGKKSRAVLAGYPLVLLPMLLLQEDYVKEKLRSLRIKEKRVDDHTTLSVAKKKALYVVRRYGGRESDVNGVLDGLLR